MLRKLARKWWFWLGSSGLFLVALVVGSLYAEWKITRARGEARRDAVVRRLDAEEPGWRLHDLAAAHNAALPPPDQNAADRMEKADALIPQAFHDWAMTKMWQPDLRPGVLPTEQDVRRASAVHCECGAALAVARSIRSHPRGGFPFAFKDLDPVGSLTPHLDKLGRVTTLLFLDAVVLSYQGRTDEAIESCHALLNCGRAIGDEPYPISQGVRMTKARFAAHAAEKVLGWGEPVKGLAELQDAFAEEMKAPRLTYVFRGQRAMAYHYLQNMDEGRISLADDDTTLPADESPLRRFKFWRFRKDLPRQQAIVLEKCDEWLAANKLDGLARRQAFRKVPFPDDPAALQKDIIAVLMTMTWDRLVDTEDETRAELGAIASGIACERYRQRFGRWPESLGAIPKDILPEVPADPYTGRPLLYAATGDGVVVYATGPDGIDDGGTHLDPRGAPGTDIGFRLLDPDQRRQLPPPDPEPEPEPNGPPPERRP